MDPELTDDQRELQRIVREVATRECPPALVRSVLDGKDADRDLWATYVSLDWPGLTVAEGEGGTGLTAVELVLVLEELGRVADPTPLLATTSQFVPLVRESGDPDQRRALLSPVGEGAVGAAAFAADEVTAVRDGEEWTLHGTAWGVLDADRADVLAVAATIGSGAEAVFVVPADAFLATRTFTYDATLHLADVVLDGVRVASDRTLVAGGRAGIERARQEAVTGMAAATVGASQRILDLALAHVRDRHQFGVPIGSFQAVKHMAVDVYVAIERARALCQLAALVIAEDDPRRAQAASMAKAAAGDAQRIAVAHGIQLFGGLGFTWENDLHLFVRRAKAGDALLGTAAEHRAAVARLALAPHRPEVVA